jgi:hypothetical protein
VEGIEPASGGNQAPPERILALAHSRNPESSVPFVRDNNNPNVPSFGIAGAAPVGTGIEISGGQNDTVVGNRIVHNGSWGVLVHDFPDDETPPPVSNCVGGIQTGPIC